MKLYSNQGTTECLHRRTFSVKIISLSDSEYRKYNGNLHDIELIIKSSVSNYFVEAIF